MGSGEVALIVGAGSGLSASLARLFATEGMRVALAARDPGKLAALAAATDAATFACDAADADGVEALFRDLDGQLGTPQLVVYNPSFRTRGPIIEIAPGDVRKSLMISAFGAFLVAQQATRRMLAAGGGSIFFTGASAGVKGYARSAPFAMGKFALRGLAQSLARELQPQNIHIAHIVVDGGILSERYREPDGAPDSLLRPDAIARTYLDLHRQHRSAWSWEIELRPWVETF